jgi:hypothetical protein
VAGLASEGRPPMKSSQSFWTGVHRRSKAAAWATARSIRSPWADQGGISSFASPDWIG